MCHDRSRATWQSVSCVTAGRSSDFRPSDGFWAARGHDADEVGTAGHRPRCQPSERGGSGGTRVVIPRSVALTEVASRRLNRPGRTARPSATGLPWRPSLRGDLQSRISHAAGRPLHGCAQQLNRWSGAKRRGCRPIVAGVAFVPVPGLSTLYRLYDSLSAVSGSTMAPLAHAERSAAASAPISRHHPP